MRFHADANLVANAVSRLGGGAGLACGGEFDHIKTQDDAQNVGDGLFTFCVNEAGDAGDKPEFINMLNRAIDQLRSLVSELEDSK